MLFRSNLVIKDFCLETLDLGSEIAFVKRQLVKVLKKKNLFQQYGYVNDMLIWLEPSIINYFDGNPNWFPQNFLLHLFHLQPFTDTVFLRSTIFQVDAETKLIEEICENLNQLTIIANKTAEDWDDVLDRIYLHTGLIAKVVENIPEKIVLEKDKWKINYPTVFFDFSNDNNILYKNIPKDTRYIDLAPTKQKERILSIKRPDIKYFTYAKYLDSQERSTL